MRPRRRWWTTGSVSGTSGTASAIVEEPAWTLMFRGERFVGLALTPRYQKRQSRFCAGFVPPFQPIKIFQYLLSTPEKMAGAVGTVRALTDSQDAVPYSNDVIAVGEGRQSVSTMFCLVMMVDRGEICTTRSEANGDNGMALKP